MRTADRALAKKMAEKKKLYEGVQVGDVFIPEHGGRRGYHSAALEAAKYSGLELLRSRSSHVVVCTSFPTCCLENQSPGAPSSENGMTRKSSASERSTIKLSELTPI